MELFRFLTHIVHMILSQYKKEENYVHRGQEMDTSLPSVRRNLDFNGKVESRLPPTPMIGEETANYGMER